MLQHNPLVLALLIQSNQPMNTWDTMSRMFVQKNYTHGFIDWYMMISRQGKREFEKRGQQQNGTL